MNCEDGGYTCVNLYFEMWDCESYHQVDNYVLTSSDSSPNVLGPLSPSASVTAEPWSSIRLSSEYL